MVFEKFQRAAKPNSPITGELSQDDKVDSTRIPKGGLKSAYSLFDELKFESMLKPFLGFWYDLKTRAPIGNIRREKQYNNRRVYLHWTDHTSQLLDIEPGTNCGYQ